MPYQDVEKEFKFRESKRQFSAAKLGTSLYPIRDYQTNKFQAFMVPKKYAGSIVLKYFRSLRMMGAVGIEGGACVGLVFWYGNAGMVAHLDSDSQGNIATVILNLLRAFGQQMKEPAKKHSLRPAPKKDQKAWIIFGDSPGRLNPLLTQLLQVRESYPNLFPKDVSSVNAKDFLLDVNTGELWGGFWRRGQKMAQFSFGDYCRFYKCPPGDTAQPIDDQIVKLLESENVRVPLGWQKWQKMMGPCYRI